MRFTQHKIAGLVLISPEVFTDSRGAFRRNFCAKELRDNGLNITVCQGNISENTSAGTMRGFHYQKDPSSEAKILTPVSGGIYNVVIDLRTSSSTFLKSVALEISSSRRESLHVPSGCANAFLTLEANTVVQYYMGDFFKPETYAGFRHNDPYFAIEWPHAVSEISERDASFPDFSLAQL
jgi:dTDP-4-dehydrorhamnose 3,5-epimerase